MQRELKRLFLCCALLLCCAAGARPSFQDQDTVLRAEDSVVSGSEDYYGEDDTEDDAEAPRVIIYNKQSPSESRWLEATSDDAYSYRTTRENVTPPPPPEPRHENPAWIRWIIAFFRFFATTPGKIILWSLLVAALGYIVYRVIVGDGGLFGRRDVSVGTVTPGEALSTESLLDTGWESRMRSALAAGDQRLTIRFGYLHLLQQLELHELIRFRPDKTNIAYYRELDAAHRPDFRSLTRIYEFAWYGEFLPDATGMDDYLRHLETFLQRISRS